MIRTCVVLNGKIINVGEWDYQRQSVMIKSPKYDDEGNVIEEAIYEEMVLNPLPEGAVIKEKDFEYSEDDGWGEVKTLNEVKNNKINELKAACQQAIFEGFTVTLNSESFSFGFNELDQMNFTQQLILIVSGDASDVKWKTQNAGVQTFSINEFMQVIEAGKNHKLAQQTKYWQLEQQVINAASVEEVEAVNW